MRLSISRVRSIPVCFRGSLPRRRRLAASRTALLLVASLSTAVSAVAASPVAIRLRSRTILPGADPAADRWAMEAAIGVHGRARGASDPAPAARPAHVLVQLARVPDAAARAQLAAAGLELQGSIGERSFLARLGSAVAEPELRALGVIWLGPIAPGDKIAPALAAAARGHDAAPSHARLAGGKIAVYVEWHPDAGGAGDEGEGRAHRDGALATLSAAGAIRELADLPLLGGQLLAVAPDQVTALAALDGVKWIEPATPSMGELTNGIRAATGVDAVYESPDGLDGSGVRVLVYDGGLACPTHPDLQGRVLHGEAGYTANHATHVSGIVGSSGMSSSGLYRGMAPAATILSYAYESCQPMCLYNNPQDLADDYTEGMSLRGADFATNSIGANIAGNGYDCALLGDYEHTARLIDAIACGGLGSPFLSFWAAGNERQGLAHCGALYGTMGVPGAAKNAVVVGATSSDTGEIAAFSSVGPVDDGRMRPDVVAPGCETTGDRGITSTRSCAGQVVLCGTSMSTPAVAGIAALVTQRLRESPRGDIALPATMKAVLGCSAEDRGNPGPDYAYGYGQVSAPAAIGIVDSGAVFESQVGHGEVVTRTLTVPEGCPELRVLLAWDDPPGEPLSLANLVNDLDLRLVDPKGGSHRPLVLDPLHPGANAQPGLNRRDPSELAAVANPIPGVWSVEIAGHLVPDGPQSFGLAATVPGRGPMSVPDPDDNFPPEGPAAVSRLKLEPNVPNPFNPATRIPFVLREGGHVRVLVYDLRGARVREILAAPLAAGRHEVTWDGRDDQGRPLASGVYVCALEQRGERQTRSMVLIR
jgi:subtilisin family serine protease